MKVTLNPSVIGQKYSLSLNKINTNGMTMPKYFLGANQIDSVNFTGTSDVSPVRHYSEENFSPLEVQRLKYQPKLPPSLTKGIDRLEISEGETTESVADQDEIKALFKETYGQPSLKFQKSKERKPAKPMKVGVLLSGGQASGGHNVITGLYDAIKEANPRSEVYGILGGPKGLIDGKYTKLTDEVVDPYRNQGGFDMLISGRDKIEKPEDFEGVLRTCKRLGLNAITIIGGDDSNTNAAVLAEWFKKHGENIQVIGCPKTIDGDLKNEHIETSFGFDTATKTYSEIVGNIAIDTASAQKYWQFVKVMGRSASHVALEVGMKTHPNITLISEEIKQKGLSLDDVATLMADIIARRAESGKNYGVAVIPEGLLDFIPEIDPMIKALDTIVITAHPIADSFAELVSKKIINKKNLPEENLQIVKEHIQTRKHYADKDKNSKVIESFNALPEKVKNELVKLFVFSHRKLNPAALAVEMIAELSLDEKNAKVFESMPSLIKPQLLQPRDEHGNLPVSQIDTEKLLIEKITEKLKEMKAEGKYSGKFKALNDFQGYGGRAGLPSNFDCDYGYSLGYSAAALINSGKTGYIATIKNLYEDTDKWVAGGAPLTMMMNMERRGGKMKPVIQKAMVDLNGPIFKKFKENRSDWAYNDKYLCPGPIQFDGPTKDFKTKTLRIEAENG